MFTVHIQESWAEMEKLSKLSSHRCNGLAVTLPAFFKHDSREGKAAQGEKTPPITATLPIRIKYNKNLSIILEQ